MEHVSERTRQFHRNHPICDMLGLNLNHPRYLIDNIDLGVRDATTRRGDFPKLKDWGLSLVVAKGGAGFYDENYEYYWKTDPTRRPGRDDEELFLSLMVKNPTQLLLAGLDRFLVNVEAHPGQVHLLRTAADIDVAADSGKLALLMAANRSDWFGDSPGVLRMFARLGLRMITLGQATRELGWDASNETRSGGRMTELGVRMIQEMNSAGILIDLAHTNDPCALDVIEVSEKPVVDSHSSPRSLEPGDRSAPDEVMKALADSGGMLGISPGISRPDADVPYREIPRSELDGTLKLVDYAINLMGVDGVGIGTHFNTAAMPWITEALLDAGYSDEDTAKIMGGNHLRVLRQVLPDG